MNLPVPERVLAIGAHPDDVEFGCGGTLAKWAAAGSLVNHLICTDGSKGSWDPDDDVAVLVATRRDEQRAAAKALGATGRVVFLDWPDGELESGVRQRWEVAYWIRKLRPTIVLGHDPWRRYRLHPDHRQAGFLACDGVVAARDPHFFPEHESPSWRPTTLLLWEADEVDHVENVTGFIGAKLAALEAHVSQFRSTMGITDAESEDERERFRHRVLDRLAGFGRPEGYTYGEGFKRIDDL
ncbi:MAG: PIG-L deacetylase family protein [Acidimicrobiales bacterium]